MIDIRRLKRDLKDIYGTAAVNVAEFVAMTVFDIDSASLEELEKLADAVGIDIRDYDDDYER